MIWNNLFFYVFFHMSGLLLLPDRKSIVFKSYCGFRYSKDGAFGETFGKEKHKMFTLCKPRKVAPQPRTKSRSSWQESKWGQGQDKDHFCVSPPVDKGSGGKIVKSHFPHLTCKIQILKAGRGERVQQNPWCERFIMRLRKLNVQGPPTTSPSKPRVGSTAVSVYWIDRHSSKCVKENI